MRTSLGTRATPAAALGRVLPGALLISALTSALTVALPVPAGAAQAGSPAWESGVSDRVALVAFESEDVLGDIDIDVDLGLDEESEDFRGFQQAAETIAEFSRQAATRGNPAPGPAPAQAPPGRPVSRVGSAPAAGTAPAAGAGAGEAEGAGGDPAQQGSASGEASTGDVTTGDASPSAPRTGDILADGPGSTGTGGSSSAAAAGIEPRPGPRTASPRSGTEQALLTGMNTLAVGLAVAGLAGAPLAGGLRRRARGVRSGHRPAPVALRPDPFPTIDDVGLDSFHTRHYGGSMDVTGREPK